LVAVAEVAIIHKLLENQEDQAAAAMDKTVAQPVLLLIVQVKV
jgi:hypothetical protein